MKTVYDSGFKIEKVDHNFNYQNNLTQKLDNYSQPFNQETINEIVLWKVNRYSELSENTITLINQIGKNWDLELTRDVIGALIREKGIQLPMASTILRFKNPNNYQIIDQRVYRIIYGIDLKLNQYKSEINIKNQIDLYLNYLKDLRIISTKLNIPFDQADRILYNTDKRLNNTVKLKNYG